MMLGAALAFGQTDSPDTLQRCQSILNDAVNGSSRDPTLAEGVESALSDKEWSMRATGVDVIAMHPFPEFQEKLVPLLDDKKGAVRVRAATAYIGLQHSAKTLPAKRSDGAL
jgi:HEAT repeat protein